jgi:hypothetical protein
MPLSTGKLTGFIKNPWTVTIGSGVVILILPGVWSAIAKVDLRHAYALVTGWFWSNFLGPRIPVWISLIAIVFMMTVQYVFHRLSSPQPDREVHPTQAAVEKPDYFIYTRDAVRNWTFRWGYFPEERGMPPTIVNLHAVCPECDAPLLKEKPHHITNEISGMYCAVCRKTFPLFDESADSGEIGIIVRHRIQTGQYRSDSMEQKRKDEGISL